MYPKHSISLPWYAVIFRIFTLVSCSTLHKQVVTQVHKKKKKKKEEEDFFPLSDDLESFVQTDLSIIDFNIIFLISFSNSDTKHL